MISAKWQTDTVPAVIGGMDASSDPTLVGQSAVAYLRNVSIRGGRAKSRPRTRKVMSITSGKIQGAGAFNERGVLLVSIDGKVYEIRPDVWTATEKTDSTTRGNPNRPRHWYCETIGSIVIQDFQSAPLIYDGSDFRKAKDDEVPVGGAMCFSNGRLAVVTGIGKSVRIGDIRQDAHQSELKFTETYFLTGGGDFSFPQPVTALHSLPVIDTSTGQGSLIVGCRGRVFSLKTQVTSRDLWPDIGFQTEMFPNVGITGQTAAAAVNQDLYFRSVDGVRSLRTTVGDFESPGQTPISREMAHRFDYDSDHLLDYASVVSFDNRLFVTHSPIHYGNRGINLGLAVYNFDTLSKSGQKSPPVFDGEWDFAQIAEIVVGNFGGRQRCFVIGRDAAGANGIWEIFREADEPVAITEAPEHVLTTRSLVGAGIDAYKALRRCDVWLSDIKSNVNLKVYYRAGQYPFWVLWDEFSVGVGTPAAWSRPRPLQRNPLSTHTVPEGFDEQTKQPLAQGFSFQIRLVWTGQCRVDFIQLATEVVIQPGVADNVEGVDGEMYAAIPSGQVDPTFWYPHTSSPAP